MERSPTYEEVQAFAKSEGLDRKTDVRKFYSYYSETNFLYKGIPMDWKAKLREWASSERRRSIAPAPASVERKYEPVTREHLEYIKKITEGWGK